jgi:hypothetical protein
VNPSGPGAEWGCLSLMADKTCDVHANSNLVVPKIIGSPVMVSHTSHQYYWASLITQEKGQSHDHRTCAIIMIGC